VTPRVPRSGRALILATLLLLAFGLVAATHAEAGTFTVRQCGSLSSNGFAGSYGLLGKSGLVTAAQGCRDGGPGRAGLYQDRSGRTVPAGTGGQYLFGTPPEVGLAAVAVSVALKEAGGFRATVVATGPGQAPVRLEEGSPADGKIRRHQWTARSGLRDQVSARLFCVREAGCDNSANATRSFLELHGVELEARDRTAPALTVPTGPGGWVSGRAAIDFAASDRGSGLASARAEVNGFSVPLAGTEHCDGLKRNVPVSLRPCAGSLSGAANAPLPTDRAPFREGRNSYRVCVADFAQPAADRNETCSTSRTIQVDNLPPARPQDLATPAGQTWSPAPAPGFTWQLPADGGSPVDRARYELSRVSSAGVLERVGAGEWDPGRSGVPGRGVVNLPQPGTYRLDLRLRDRAGNLGLPATTTVRFDDRPPSPIVPERPPAWLSADDLPHRAALSRATPGGPSGVAGYAFSLSDGDVSDHPCAGSVCRPDEVDLKGGPDDRVARLDNLPEGRSWLTAAAVSGAGVASREAGTVALDVDLTPPTTRLDGLPDGWSRDPVELQVTATDRLSGMEARPGLPAPPVTSIVSADGRRFDSPGDRTEMTIRQEGETVVEFFARDLAGNVNDGLTGPTGGRHPSPGSAVVRIDRTGPRLRLEAVGSPGDPELVRVRVEDSLSGVTEGRIALTRSGGGPATRLSTTLRNGRLEARIPSDDLPDGDYVISAEATDRAGNRTSPAIPAGQSDGSWPVELPLKETAEVSIRFAGQPAGLASLKAGPTESTPVAGRVVTRKGPGPDEVSITESFSPGSSIGERITEVPVLADGSFRASLRPGPSRTVRATYAGSALTRRTTSRPVSLSVRDLVSFSLSPGIVRNGSRVLMKGRVVAGPSAPSLLGKQVAIEFFDPGRRSWRPVGLVGAGVSGRFRFAYRFSTISSTQRIIFRARSLREVGWPFDGSASRPKQVIVKPRRGP